MILTTSAAVADFCAKLKGAPYVAIDTEFVRERTYYAQLCLIQLAYGEHAAAIDPLAPGIDLSPLHALLADTSVLKVFHAAGQDLEIFLQTTGAVPGPLFDTQIAASVCGLGDTPGYAALVSSVLGIELDKASQRTDWSRRPLTPRQVTYALGDVTHLCTLYDRLSAQLAERGRTEWIAEEMAALSDPARYRVEPSEAWRRIKIRGPDRRALGLMRALAEWRETTAMTRDLPRPWVLHDDALVEIAQHAPDSVDALASVRAIKQPVARGADGKAILEIIRRTLAEGESTWPEVPPRKGPIDANEPLVALLMALLRVRCDAQGVAPRIVASREDVELLAVEESPDIAALRGWRRTIFGEDALALRAGRLAMTGSAGGVITIEPS